MVVQIIGVGALSAFRVDDNLISMSMSSVSVMILSTPIIALRRQVMVAS